MKVNFLISLLTIFVCHVSAQKLPNVQEKSLRAPTAIKIDGKADEWNNQFQAYNKATEIFYTLSNDNDKLYLAVQATDLDIINKIMCSGVTLTINGSGKKKDMAGVAITFPYLDIDREKYWNEPGTPAYPPIKSLNMIKQNSENSKELTATFMTSFNDELGSKAKDIMVSGISEIKEPMISIYNPDGIKVAALADINRNYTYELAMPLKYLGLSLKDPKPFFYNIKLAGMNPDMTDAFSIAAAMRAQRTEIRNSPSEQVLFKLPGMIMMGPGPRLQAIFSPTDFSGEYTLAK